MHFPGFTVISALGGRYFGCRNPILFPDIPVIAPRSIMDASQIIKFNRQGWFDSNIIGSNLIYKKYNSSNIIFDAFHLVRSLLMRYTKISQKIRKLIRKYREFFLWEIISRLLQSPTKSYRMQHLFQKKLGESRLSAACRQNRICEKTIESALSIQLLKLRQIP